METNAAGDYWARKFAEKFLELNHTHEVVQRIYDNVANDLRPSDLRALIDTIRNCEFDGTIEEQIITYCVMNRIDGD